MTEALARVADSGPLRPADVVHQVSLVQEVMRAVMKPNEHYGTIPGCGTKPTLLQPGAQVLALTFRISPSFAITDKELAGGHREFVVHCTLTSIATGLTAGSGLGLASTMESKYRYRNVSDFEVLDEPIPQDSKERKAEYRKQGFGMKMVDGAWCWVRYKDSARVENPDIADTYNTVLKIATKRAFVHAVLNATAASDMFTQDIEDYRNAAEAEPPASESTIFTLRTMRDDLKVSEEKYVEQLEYFCVTTDTDLTQKQAVILIGQYGKRLEEKTAQERVEAAQDKPEEDLSQQDEVEF